MDYTGRVSLTIAVGIAVGLIYTRRTGWSTGGLVTPGLLALQAADPLSFAGALLLGLGFAVVLRPVAKFFSLYGRDRVGAALLLAIAFRLLFRGQIGVDAFWIGWIAPGLIAADAERQGAAMTLVAAASTGIATAIAVFFMTLAAGYLS